VHKEDLRDFDRCDGAGGSGVEVVSEGRCGKQGAMLLVSSKGRPPPRIWQAPQ
jgi:hypothetical protein